jgi:hypothetical protein
MRFLLRVASSCTGFESDIDDIPFLVVNDVAP